MTTGLEALLEKLALSPTMAAGLEHALMGGLGWGATGAAVGALAPQEGKSRLRSAGEGALLAGVPGAALHGLGGYHGQKTKTRRATADAAWTKRRDDQRATWKGEADARQAKWKAESDAWDAGRAERQAKYKADAEAQQAKYKAEANAKWDADNPDARADARRSDRRARHDAWYEDFKARTDKAYEEAKARAGASGRRDPDYEPSAGRGVPGSGTGPDPEPSYWDNPDADDPFANFWKNWRRDAGARGGGGGRAPGGAGPRAGATDPAGRADARQRAQHARAIGGLDDVAPWLKGVTTQAEAKQRFRAEARVNHPDAGGSTEAMKQTNAQWDAAQGHPEFMNLKKAFFVGFKAACAAFGVAA